MENRQIILQSAIHELYLICSFHFPTMQMIGEDLVTVLDFLHIKYVIGLGEGAGANILLRFGMAHASVCYLHQRLDNL